MDTHDRQAIDSLFEKLANVEQQSQARDSEAEAYIEEWVERQPQAPYYMAQTVVVQERALIAAQARIEQLEREIASKLSSAGGLVSSVFGNRATGSVPRVGRGEGTSSQAFQQSPYGAGGGCLAGAAQTSMGVAGGVLLGNMIAGMFGSDQAKAAEPQADNAGTEAQDTSLDDTRTGRHWIG